MNDSTDSGSRGAGSAGPSKTHNETTEIQLELRPRTIESEPAPRSSSLSPPLHRTATDTKHPASAPSQSLTSFDWLDSIVDEMLIATDTDTDTDTDTKTVGGGGTDSVAQRAGLPAWSGTEFADISLDRSGTAVLGQVILGYSPIVDRRHTVIGTRLTVVPVRADAALDASALLRAVGEVWPAGGGVVSLNVASETLLSDLLRTTPTMNVMIEVPSFLAAEPANVNALIELSARGNTLMLKDRPLRELPREVLGCFKWSIIDLSDDRRVGQARPPQARDRTIPHIQTGVRTMAQLRECFDRGAAAVVGWPIGEAITQEIGGRPEVSAVVEMINKIDQGEPIEAIALTLMRDPVLAFELLRHINGPSFGLSVDTSSFRHAIMVVGYPQLKRWLAGWLANTDDSSRLRPAKFAALRRGLLMRELAPISSSAETRGELFICGLFSLLDRMFAEPLQELLKTVVVSGPVRQALVDRGGSFFPLLELVRAVESSVPQDIRAAADAVFVDPFEINRAVLRTLRIASAID